MNNAYTKEQIEKAFKKVYKDLTYFEQKLYASPGDYSDVVSRELAELLISLMEEDE